jgi:hypothetical protein
VTAVKFFILILALATSSRVFADFERDPKPFWLEPKNQTRLNEREILVSVLNQDGRTSIKGVGLVRASLEKCFRFAQNYERLASFKGRFSDVHFDPTRRDLSLTVHLPFRKERLKFHVTPGGQGRERFVEFEVLEGLGKGTAGLLLIEDLERQDRQVRVSFQALTKQGEKFSWLLNLGIEALLRHVANSLRFQLEE